MTKVLRLIRSLLLLPVAVVIGLPVAVFLGAVIAWHLPSEFLENHRWRQKLALAGRLNRSKTFRDRLTTGTLIVDSPTLGWGLLHCWWTADDIPSLSPIPEPTDGDREKHMRSDSHSLCLPWDRWIAKTYLDRDDGKAILIATRRGDRIAELITAKSSAIHAVRSWSAPVHLDTQPELPG
jgi:hypothetical protein